MKFFNSFVTLALGFAYVAAVSLDVTSEELICNAAWDTIIGQFNYYNGFKYGGAVGTFVEPYYWWNAGEAFGGWVDYWSFCASNNDTFETILLNAMYAQRGQNNNYMPSNQSMTEGNDDQGVWGMAIMQAVERNFTQPSDHTWLYLVQALFNSMNNRWDTSTCGGGLRWQIFTWNSGYNYKNSISNGCLFHLAARLYRYTGEELYLGVAEKVWNWMWDVGFMNYTLDDHTFIIYDGADDTEDCKDLTVHKWSYTYGVYLAGCAYLAAATNNSQWQQNTQVILQASLYFFNNSIMTEMTCAPFGMCNNDQRSFRSLFARCLGLTANLLPLDRDQILNDWLIPSAKGAATSCSGGNDRITCGENWSYGGYDGKYGLGEQMSAAETILSLIAVNTDPLTTNTGGSSVGGDVSAGNSTTSATQNQNLIDVKTKDKAGAAVLTAVVLGTLLAGAIWMLF